MYNELNLQQCWFCTLFFSPEVISSPCTYLIARQGSTPSSYFVGIFLKGFHQKADIAQIWTWRLKFLSSPWWQNSHGGKRCSLLNPDQAVAELLSTLHTTIPAMVLLPQGTMLLFEQTLKGWFLTISSLSFPESKRGCQDPQLHPS